MPATFSEENASPPNGHHPGSRRGNTWYQISHAWNDMRSRQQGIYQQVRFLIEKVTLTHNKHYNYSLKNVRVVSYQIDTKCGVYKTWEKSVIQQLLPRVYTVLSEVNGWANCTQVSNMKWQSGHNIGAIWDTSVTVESKGSCLVNSSSMTVDRIKNVLHVSPWKMWEGSVHV